MTIAKVSLQEMPLAAAMLKLAGLDDPQFDTGEPPQELPPAEHKLAPALRALGSIGAGALAFGGGYGLGHLGASKLLPALGKHVPSPALARAIPVLGGAAGLAYHAYQAQQQKQVQRAIEAYKNQSRSGEQHIQGRATPPAADSV